MHYDVIVIGGGPSGLMAAIGAAEEGASVLLLDKGNKLGRKLAISGGGRCNVTNRLPLDEIVKHIPGNGRFLYSAFSIFNNEDIITFFENLGVKLKEEDHGRMFPVSNKAQSVVDALLTRLKDLGVKIRTNTPVETIEYENGQTKAVVLKTGEVLETNHVVIAVGGKSVPQTGSTGDGYAWAKSWPYNYRIIPNRSTNPFKRTIYSRSFITRTCFTRRKFKCIKSERKSYHFSQNGHALHSFRPIWSCCPSL